jgi:hypothetical protein
MGNRAAMAATASWMTASLFLLAHGEERGTRKRLDDIHSLGRVAQ